jgi:hypothetical protein
VPRPREQVAAFMTDPANDREWIGGLRDVRVLGPEPLASGSRVARVASFLGRRIEYVNEILAFEAGRRLEMRSVKAPFPMHITYTFEDMGGGTRVRNRVRGGAEGPARLLSPLTARMVRRNVQRDLDSLRRRLDG